MDYVIIVLVIVYVPLLSFGVFVVYKIRKMKRAEHEAAYRRWE